MILDDMFDQQEQPEESVNPLQRLMDRNRQIETQLKEIQAKPAPTLAEPVKDDLEPISVDVMRGFFKGAMPPSNTPDFGKIFRQSVSPGREFLANMLNGVSASFLGTKFTTVRDQAFQRYHEEQKLNMERDQLRRQAMQGMAGIAQDIYKQRGEEALRRSIAAVNTAEGAEDRSLKTVQALQTAQRFNLDIEKFMKDEETKRAAVIHEGPPAFKVALNLVESRLKLNNVDTQSPAGHNQLMQEAVAEWQKIEAAEAKLKGENRPAPLPYMFSVTGPDGNQYIGALDKRTQQLLGGAYVGRKLTAEQLTSVNEMRNAASNMRQAIQVAQNSPDAIGGFAQQMPPEMRARFGALSSSERTLRMHYNAAAASYVRSISGAAATDKEREFHMQGLPKLYEKPENFFPGAYAFASMLDASALRTQYGLEVDLAPAMHAYAKKMEDYIQKNGSAKGMPILSSQQFLDMALKGYGKKIVKGQFGTMELVDDK